IAADGPSLEKVLALDGQAKEAGVTVVTGIGHVPGMSNLIMQHAANQLETVTDLRLCVWWQLSREETDLFGDLDAMRKTGRVNASWQTVLTWVAGRRSEEHTSELQSPCNLVCRLLLEKKKH